MFCYYEGSIDVIQFECHRLVNTFDTLSYVYYCPWTKPKCKSNFFSFVCIITATNVMDFFYIYTLTNAKCSFKQQTVLFERKNVHLSEKIVCRTKFTFMFFRKHTVARIPEAKNRTNVYYNRILRTPRKY